MNRVFSKDSALSFLPLIFIVLLAILLTSPLWQQEGIPHTADGHFHVYRSAAMQRAFEQGVVWPRWFPNSSHGRGAPTFHYYGPGLYWLVGAVHWAGIGLDQALTLLLTAAFILSGWGGYAWLRYTFSPIASLASSAIYLGMPHIFSRTFLSSGDYPQLFTFLLFPVCLWACTALYMQRRIRYWLAVVISLAALVVSHQQQAMIGAGALVVYCLLLTAGYRKLDGLARCAIAALLAAMLTAAYWLPALGDLPLIQMEGALQDRGFYGNHFLTWRTLFSTQPFVWDSRAGNPLALPHNTFGAAQWLSASIGLAGVLIWRRERKYLIWCIAGILFSLSILTLTVPISAFLWETIPGLSFLQYPFRLLPAAVLGVLPAAAMAVDVWPQRFRWISSCVLVLVAVIFPFPYLFPDLASQTTIVSTKSLTAEETQSRGVGVLNFLPLEADRDIMMGIRSEPEAIALTWRSPHEAAADLTGRREPILLRLHYFSGWSAGDRATLTSGPAGFTQVTNLRNPDEPLVLHWAGTAWQRRGERISLVGLLVCIAGIVFLVWQRKRERRSNAVSIHAEHEKIFTTTNFQLEQWALVGVICTLVVVRIAISWSDTFPFLYHSPPGHLAFASEGQPTTLGDAGSNQMTLLGWKLLSGTSPKPGNTIVVRLYLQPHGRITEELNTFVHLYTPALKRSWAVENHGVYRPSVKIWNPDQYFVETIHLVVPTDVPPITFALVAGLATPSGERLTVPGTPDGVLQLLDLTVSPIRTGILQRERPGTAARADTEDNLRLQGYDLLPGRDVPALRLFWEARGNVATNWTTYIHLHAPWGERIAQFDGPPLAGLKPTSAWQRRELYIDRRQLSLPLNLPAGDYLFRIGLYDGESGERLAFLPEADDQVHFEDGQLLVPLRISSE